MRNLKFSNGQLDIHRNQVRLEYGQIRSKHPFQLNLGDKPIVSGVKLLKHHNQETRPAEKPHRPLRQLHNVQAKLEAMISKFKSENKKHFPRSNDFMTHSREDISQGKRKKTSISNLSNIDLSFNEMASRISLSPAKSVRKTDRYCNQTNYDEVFEKVSRSRPWEKSSLVNSIMSKSRSIYSKQ